MSDPKTTSTSTNENIKFYSTHAFLQKKLSENNGCLTKSDFKELQLMLNQYNALSPIIAYKKAVGDFCILDISLKQFRNQDVGNSRIIFNEGLKNGYKVNIKKYDSFNKLIGNSAYTNRKITIEPQYPTIPNFCEKLKRDIPSKQLIYAGTMVPKRSKIIISSILTDGPTPYNNAKSQTINLMHTFYKDENNKKRLLQVAENYNDLSFS